MTERLPSMFDDAGLRFLSCLVKYIYIIFSADFTQFYLYVKNAIIHIECKEPKTDFIVN